MPKNLQRLIARLRNRVETSFKEITDQMARHRRAVAACDQQIADSRTRPAQDLEDVLSQLGRDGLVESSAALRAG